MTARRWAALEKWLLLGILLLAFGLRVYRLGAESLWYDETVSVYLAGKSVPALVAHTAGDIHPPGYYLLLHVWTRLAGNSDFSTGFFSLIFGMLLVPLAYRLAAGVFDKKVGLLAALLVACSPFHIWYSQEVRMYTLGAVLGMGALGAVALLLAAPPDGPPAWSRLAVYVVCGALGLWMLYYFAFLLVAINLMVLAWWLVARRKSRQGWAWLGRWLLAQGAILLLYLPWIGVAWRQATQPPVPPWRGYTGLGPLLLESWSALSLGQSAELAWAWPALLLFAVLFGLGLFYRPEGWGRTNIGWVVRGFLTGCLFLPLLLIYLASFVTPLFHVRYVYTYATPFYIFVAAGLAWLGQRWRPALALALAVLALFAGLSIYAYHTDPRYASDDHRAATAFLADRWRPGDAILINAGYAYTAPVVYWDGDPIAWRGRLVEDYGAGQNGPVMVQTGTVDGALTLGWGDPGSDFYAMGQAETIESLERLFTGFDRVWVYRIYDTVTDPDGLLRDWLVENGTQFEDLVFTGESQLRVQGFLTGREPAPQQTPSQEAALADGSLRLAGSSWPSEVEVGGEIDLALLWEVGSSLGEDVTLFAGLFDQEGGRWAQTDEQPLGSLLPPSEWQAGDLLRTPLRLEVPPDTPPGSYRLETGWYRFEGGQPVWLPWLSGERLSLGEVRVVPPEDWLALPELEPSHPVDVTMGPGVRLLGLDALELEGNPGDVVELDLLWQAVEDTPAAGQAVLQLADDEGRLLAEAASAPAGGRAPFASLVAGQAVRDPRSLTLPGSLEPGVYNLLLGRRGPDGAWRPVRRGVFPLGSTYPLATVRVRGRPLERTPPQVQQPKDARFGDAIGLIGYDLESPPHEDRAPGGKRSLALTLHWQALAPMADGYKVFVHLVGEGGPADIRAQADFYPHLPTTGWVPGEYLSDDIAIELPHDLPPGAYSLLLGLYDEATGARLTVSDPSGMVLGDSLLLDEILLPE